MMNSKWKLMLCLLLAALTLCACSGGQSSNAPVFDQATQYLGPTPTDTPVPQATQEPVTGDAGASVFSANPYDVASDFTEADALNEEDIIDAGLVGGDPASDPASAFDAYASAEGTVYPYAGSTPIPLDPVDMPSPTPRPQLTFTYMPYTVSIGLTFEAPVGWVADESQNELFILSEPPEQMKLNQLCVLTIAASPVTSNYSESNLKTEVRQRLDAIGAASFLEWKPSLTATRHLLGSVGVYANYTGTTAEGVEVGGRIHYACVDKVLYSVEIVFPLEYKEDFLNVFSKVRETIKRVQ